MPNRHVLICDGCRDSRLDDANQPDLPHSLQNYPERIATVQQKPFGRLVVLPIAGEQGIEPNKVTAITPRKYRKVLETNEGPESP